MKFLIISGMSGAGKTRTADVLEDLDFYCVDNMPAALLPKLAEFCMGMGGRYDRVALVTDIRDKEGVDAIFDSLEKLWEIGCDYEILFVEADKATVVKRYKESRRPHPLQHEAGSIEAAYDLERERLTRLRDSADFILDTSHLTLGQLQKEIYLRFVGNVTDRALRLNVMSFGFKYGIPMEADMVLDARFLPTPYYVEALRSKTGQDQEVYDYVFQNQTGREFLKKVKELVLFLVPQYIEEGKHELTIAVGCTGGRHRSVSVARALAETLNAASFPAECIHRDIEK